MGTSVAPKWAEGKGNSCADFWVGRIGGFFSRCGASALAEILARGAAGLSPLPLGSGQAQAGQARRLSPHEHLSIVRCWSSVMYSGEGAVATVSGEYWGG